MPSAVHELLISASTDSRLKISRRPGGADCKNGGGAANTDRAMRVATSIVSLATMAWPYLREGGRLQLVLPRATLQTSPRRDLAASAGQHRHRVLNGYERKSLMMDAAVIACDILTGVAENSSSTRLNGTSAGNFACELSNVRVRHAIGSASNTTFSDHGDGSGGRSEEDESAAAQQDDVLSIVRRTGRPPRVVPSVSPVATIAAVSPPSPPSSSSPPPSLKTALVGQAPPYPMSKAYAINLHRRPARWHALQAHLADRGVRVRGQGEAEAGDQAVYVERFNASDGREMDILSPQVSIK
jgi:hypothetical protein